MTVESTISRADYVAAAGQTVFEFSFKYFEPTDVQVYVNRVRLTTGFTVTPSIQGVAFGGSVTLTTPSTVDDAVSIIRLLPLTQLSDYEPNAALDEQTLENDLDRQTMLNQQQQEALARRPALPPDSLFSNLEIVDPSSAIVGHAIVWREVTPNVFSLGASARNVDAAVDQLDQIVADVQADAATASAAATAASNSETAAASSESAAAISASAAQAVIDNNRVPLGTPQWTTGIELAAGYIWGRGQTELRAAWPEGWAWVQNQGPKFITDAEWLAKEAADPDGAVPFWSSGDGSTTFRAPKLVHFPRAALDTVARDGALDSIQGHYHAVTYRSPAGVADTTNRPAIAATSPNQSPSVSGVSKIVASTGATLRELSNDFVAATPETDGTNGTPRVGDETAPRHFYMPFMIKMAGAVVNEGSVDALQLQAQINTNAGNIDTITSTTIPDAVAPLLGTDSYIKIVDEKTSGTAAGGFTSGAWRVRTLNTVKANTVANASLDVLTSQISLPSGKYFVRFSSPAYQVNSHKCRLYNITDSSITIDGDSAFTSAAHAVVTRTEGFGDFTITGTKVFRVEHQAQTTRATNGLGVNSSFGDVEVFTTVEIWKVS